MTTPEPVAGLLDIAPYVGGESQIAGVERVIKLSSNEGAFGPSPKAEAAIAREAHDFFRYPDGDSSALRARLAAKHHIPVENIVCGAGSDELIQLLLRCYADRGDEIVVSAHGFAMYPIYARGVGAKIVTAPERNITVDVDAVLACVTEKTRIVFVANPNNPTGTYIPEGEVRRLHAGLPGNVLLVLDSAYAEYMDRDDHTDGAELVAETENVVMLRTFSKIYGLGGFRVGWGYFPDKVADVLNRVRSPFNVSYPGQVAAHAALDDDDFIAKSHAHNLRWRRWTTETVRQLGLDVPDSVCNFVLVRFPDDDGTRADAADKFLKARGIIVRRMGGYGLPNALRISIGLEDEMRAVVDALSEFTGAK